MRSHDTRREEPSPHRQEVRDEGHREPELRRDLGRVLVDADAIGRDVLQHDSGVGRRARRATGARHARLRVDDDARGLDRVCDRSEREQDRSRVAARIGDEPPARRAQLREAVRPRPERVGPRMLEAVPLGIDAGVVEAVRTGQVDDDAARRRLERCGFLVRKTEERDVGARLQRRLVRDEPRHAAPAVASEPRVEHARCLAGQRVRPERVQLESRVCEDAVQGLLARVAGRASDGDARHPRIMHILAILCAR